MRMEGKMEEEKKGLEMEMAELSESSFYLK